MNIEERVKVAILVKYYGALLTEKQQIILSMYVDNNLSYAEVSEELNISRQAVKDALDKAYETLINAENKLHFIERDNKIKEFIEAKSNNEIDLATKLKIIEKLEE